jgi:hypothetical protein
MHHRFLFLPILLLSLSGPAQAADSEVTVVGALDFAFKDLTLESPGGGGAQFNTTLITINPGVAVAYRRVYVNINFDKSIDSASTTQIENGLPAMLTMSRSDAVLTLGYRVFDSVSLYAGWLSGEIGAYLIGERQTAGLGTYVFYTQEISYTEKGPFAGIAFAHNFSDKGSVSISVAYAKLDGEISQTRYTGGATPGTAYDNNGSDVKGLSYSLIWTGPLNGSMSYRLGVKSTRYEGDAIGSEPGINEYYTSLFLGLTNTF